MNRILIIFGYRFEKAVETFKYPFRIDDTVCHNLMDSKNETLMWSYGFRPQVELRTDGTDSRQIECVVNYNIMTHLLRTHPPRLTYDTWESKEPVSEKSKGK